MDDYLAMGSLIARRLESQIVDIPVRILTDLDALDLSVFRGSAIYVAYAGESVKADPMTGHCQTLTQLWLTILSMQFSGKAMDASIPMGKAGPLLSRMGAALQAHEFAEITNGLPLIRVTPPAPRYQAGFVHFPLAWAATLLMVNQ